MWSGPAGSWAFAAIARSAWFPRSERPGGRDASIAPAAPEGQQALLPRMCTQKVLCTSRINDTVRQGPIRVQPGSFAPAMLALRWRVRPVQLM